MENDCPPGAPVSATTAANETVDDTPPTLSVPVPLNVARVVFPIRVITSRVMLSETNSVPEPPGVVGRMCTNRWPVTVAQFGPEVSTSKEKVGSMRSNDGTFPLPNTRGQHVAAQTGVSATPILAMKPS